ncbi:hypothetical protein D3C71_1791870 [compost metagenome]
MPGGEHDHQRRQQTAHEDDLPHIHCAGDGFDERVVARERDHRQAHEKNAAEIGGGLHAGCPATPGKRPALPADGEANP